MTKNIYPKYNKPEHFVKLGRKKIERLIKVLEYLLSKKRLQFVKTLVEKYGGRVLKRLTTRGVGSYIKLLVL